MAESATSASPSSEQSPELGPDKRKGIATLAWFALGVNVLTILGGTLVRATHSGAGCGESWPTCHGEVLPGLSSMKTLIEFSHRAVSGMAFLVVLVLFVRVLRNFDKGTAVRKAMWTTVVAFVIESLLGAWLVLARLVEEDTSVMRAISVPVHLVNTLFLLGCLTATAWTLHRDRPLPWFTERRLKGLGIAAAGLALIGATGAVAALADTLFPVESLKEGLAADFDTRAHFLTRLRIIHPIVAVAVSAFLLHYSARAMERSPRLGRAVFGLVFVQLALGLANVVLLTPIAVQILHLLLADLLWIGVLVLGAEAAEIASPLPPNGG